MVVGAVALIAGGDGMTAARLAVSMTTLQASIGSLNDVVDAPRDVDHKPGKPIPAGLVSPRLAVAVVAAGAGVGVGLAIPSGWATAGLAIVVLTIGYGYDLRVKGTAWSWLPFAIGLPLLPVYAWVGASGRVPAAFAILIPVAIAAGGAVALLNGLVDIERDRAAGVVTAAVRLGPRRARAAAAGLLALIAIVVAGSLLAIGAGVGAWAVAGLGVAFTAAGAVAVGDRLSARRERGWEAGAVGLALLAAGWAIGFAERGLL